MTPALDTATLESLQAIAAKTAGLDLLLLFGSRARGDASVQSDWDLGYLASADVDISGLRAAIVELLDTDGVDLVDLSRAGGLLRYRAARDGVVVFQARPRLAEAFALEAVDFWCDAGSLLQQGYDNVLAELDR